MVSECIDYSGEAVLEHGCVWVRCARILVWRGGIIIIVNLRGFPFFYLYVCVVEVLTQKTCNK